MKQTAELVELFREKGRKQQYRKGDFIIRPGDAPSGVFYIDEGIVKAYDITKYGGENLLIIRKEHELFPLIWALTGQERQVIYQALAPTTLWQIKRQDFLDFITTEPAALAPLLDMTIEMYRLHSERIINLEYRSVRERLISFLLTMANRFGHSVQNGVVISVPLKHQDIASSINSSRETTSRELAAMERQGLLTNRQTEIILCNVPALEDHLGHSA